MIGALCVLLGLILVLGLTVVWWAAMLAVGAWLWSAGPVAVILAIGVIVIAVKK